MTTIGVLVSDLYDSYQKTLLKGLESFAERNNIRILTFVGGGIDEHVSSYFLDRSVYSKISKAAVDCILLFSGPLSAKCGNDGLQKLLTMLPDIPKISVGIKLQGVPSVYIDNKKGLREIIKHLVEVHGKKKIGFIKGPDANSEAYDRFVAYKEGLKENGIKYNYKLVAPGSFAPGDGVKALNLIMDTRKQDLDAVVCCDDYVAIEVCSKLFERGIKVPDEVAVTGFDDLDRSRSFTPSLTTVRQPIFFIGFLAGELSQTVLENSGKADDIYIDTQDIYRESCGCSTSIKFDSYKGEKKATTFEKQIKIKEKELINELNIGKNISIQISPYIIEIADALIKCENSRDIDYIKGVVESVLRETYKVHFKGSFWENVLKGFFESLKVLGMDKEEEFFILSIMNAALFKLYEFEKRIIDFNQIDDRTVLEYMNRSGNQLLFSKSDDELKGILRRNLSILRIKSCFIALTSPGSEMGELFFYRNSDNPVEDKRITFKVDEIIPKEVGEKCVCSYVIYPLVVDNSPKGYVLIESTNTPAIVFDLLVEKVAYGFKNIDMHKQIQSYTDMLERAVEERTKKLKLVNERLKERSMKDQLTGLKNRRFLDEVILPKSEKLTQKFLNTITYGDNRLHSSKNVSFGIILVDLDHFKMVNDVYGHASGDMVIKELGKIFSYSIRNDDYVVRLGGEEFLLVLRDFNGNFIDLVVEKVRKAVEETTFVMENGEKINKTCSLGAIVFPPSAFFPNLIDFHTSISIIDKCMYIAKEQGRNKGIIINFDFEKLKKIENPGDYILNNFESCLATGEISIKDSREN